MRQLLLVGGDRGTLELVARGLSAVCEITHAATARAARRLLRGSTPHIAILAATLPDGSGLALLAELKRRCPRLPVVIVTASGSKATWAEALRKGADGGLAKSLSTAEVRRLVLTMNVAGSGAPAFRSAVRVRRAARYVERHYSEPLHLKTVAEAVGMSLYSLSRAFKPILSVNFNQYRRLVRLAKARQLLANQAHSVTEVANGVGYDLAYFDRVFRKETGISPREYRKWARAANGRAATHAKQRAKDA